MAPQRLRPARLHNSRPCTASATTMMTLMLLLLFATRPSSAQIMEFDAQIYESTFFQELAIRGEIHIDRRAPPPRPGVYVQRRQAGDSVVPTTVAEPTSVSTSTISSSTSSSAEST